VYVVEQGALVSMKDGRLVVSRGSAMLRDIRLAEVDQLAVLGNVTITSHAARALLRKGVDTIYLTMGGSFLGRSATDIEEYLTQKAQHVTLADSGVALKLAKRFVVAKIGNQRRVIRARGAGMRSRSSRRCSWRSAWHRKRSTTRATWTNCEESKARAAAEYFRAFGVLLKRRDRVEGTKGRAAARSGEMSCSASGTTMIGNVMMGSVETRGFDHISARSMPSPTAAVALPRLIEEFRPILVDTTVLTVLKNPPSKTRRLADSLVPRKARLSAKKNSCAARRWIPLKGTRQKFSDFFREKRAARRVPIIFQQEKRLSFWEKVGENPAMGERRFGVRGAVL